MAQRRSLYQPANERSGMVPYRKNSSTLVPLLPFERDLIGILGWSEEEYRKFTTEVAVRGGRRPEGYENIPDIVNDPTGGILTSIVIGLVLTAVSVLLAPDIPEPESPEQQNRRSGNSNKLSDRTGRGRFGTSTGFDSVAELADYGSPIPIVFANYEDGIGGVMSAPQLVWSRTLSYGREQAVKLLMVLGEAGLAEGIDRPDLAGIYLGNSPLDTATANQYAFYWNRNTNVNGRILAKNFAYGTRATAFAGDTQGNDDIYLLPTSTGKQMWFSGSFTPSSATQFGCYSAMANGCGYRLNYQLMPFPRAEDNDEQMEQDENWAIKLGRGKNTGFWGILGPNGPGDLGGTRFNDAVRSLGQKGVGREYGRMMGITQYNGQDFAGGPADHKRKVDAVVGDTIAYTIFGSVISEGYYQKDGRIPAPVDDINNATIRFREEADDALQIGVRVMIGKSLWLVEARGIAVWGQNQVGPFQPRETQTITLRCIETFGPSSSIGYVSTQMVTRIFRTDDQGLNSYNYGDDNRLGLTGGPGFYPLMLVEFAAVRNTRPAIATEIGLRSQVWNRASGICNFSGLPTPIVFRDTDENGDSLQNGTFNGYFRRTSVFTVQVRPAGADPNNEPFPWALINEQFCVQGESPVDQYNFLRFNNPEEREYEYRFIPKNGADVIQNMPDEQALWMLDARLDGFTAGARLTGSYPTAYGTFVVEAVGRVVSKSQIVFCPEMATDTTVTTQVRYTDAPAQILLQEYFPGVGDLGNGLETGSAIQTASFLQLLPFNATQYREACLAWELFGQSSSMGLTRTVTKLATGLVDSKTVTLKYTGVVNKNFPASNPYFPGFRAWSITSVQFVSSTGNFNVGEQINVAFPTTPGNPRNPFNFTMTGSRIVVNTIKESVVLGGRESAYEYELFGNPDSQKGQVKQASFFIQSGAGDSSQLVLTAQSVIANAAYTEKFGLVNAWDLRSVQAVPGTTSGDWDVGEVALHTVPVSNNNPFVDVPDVGAFYQVANTRSEIEVVGLNSERVFEQNAQVTDMSNYTERETSNSSGPEHSIQYVNEFVAQAPVPQFDRLTTCGLALRASKTFSSLDQVRVWLKSGVEVERFHPSEAGTIGPSNMFPDLLYFLLTDVKSGVGKLFAKDLIDQESFARSCQFLRTNKLFYNGAISDVINLRSFAADTAPQLLLNFVIANGKIGLEPAVPVTPAGTISSAPVPISAIFTGGNIFDGTYEMQYLPAETRRNFIANVVWRKETPNKFPETQTLTMRWNESGGENYPMESIDLSNFCCSEEHAKLVAILQLSLRRRTTHSVSFQTSPYGLALAPGDYIRVDTVASPYQSANNGIIESDGTIISAVALVDGTVYPIFYYRRDMEEIAEASMEVEDGKATDPSLFDSVFTLQYQARGIGVYQVMELTLEEEGPVTIKATEHPVDGNGSSLIAADLLNPSSFIQQY